jgi:hypothetical protein
MPRPPPAPTRPGPSLPRAATLGDDDLDDLPPLDGAIGDPAEPDLAVDEIEADVREETPSLDDATGEDEPVDPAELDVDESDDGWLEEPPDAPNLDVGDATALDVGVDETLPPVDDADGPHAGNEEGGFGEGLDPSGPVGERAREEHGRLDAGDEGPLDADEELRDEDLPDMDADEEGQLQDEELLDDRFTADDPLGLPWAGEPWPRVGAPVVLTCATVVACAARGALVVARSDSGAAELLQIDLEGTRQTVPALGLDGADVVALSVDGDAVAAVAEGGRLLVSRDGGAHFLPMAEGVVVVDVVVAAGAIWILTRAGALLASYGGSDAIVRCSVSNPVAAMSRDGPTGIVGITVDGVRRPASLVRGGPDGAMTHEVVIEAPEALGPALLGARGPYSAYAVRRGVARRGPDGAWRSFEWEGRITALTFVDDAGTLLAATYSDSDDTTGLVRLDPSGRASVVARMGAAPRYIDSDGRALALACDDPHGVVWVAGGFGLAAFEIR